MRRVTRTVRANVARTLELAMRGTSVSWAAADSPGAGRIRPLSAVLPPLPPAGWAPGESGAVTSRGRDGAAP